MGVGMRLACKTMPRAAKPSPPAANGGSARQPSRTRPKKANEAKKAPAKAAAPVGKTPAKKASAKAAAPVGKPTPGTTPAPTDGAAPAAPAPSSSVPSAKKPASTLGRAIRVRRVELGLKRHALAERAGLSYPYVSELERDRKSPSSAAMVAIAAALDLSPAELLARAEHLARADRHGAPASSGPDDHAHLAVLVRDIVRQELAGSRHAVGSPDGYPRSEATRERSHDDGQQPGSDHVAPSAAAIREAVLTATRAMLDNEAIDFDGEGDIPIRRNDVMLFVRVLDDPLSVLVFSPMLVGIDESAALLERVNELNANIHFVRFCVTHGGVVADIELFADPFAPALVEAACRALTQTAEVVGPELQVEYGGRLFFGDDHEPKPRPGTGGYL